MNDLTQQQTQARFRTLPVQLRNTLADPDTYEKIALVAKKYGLTRVETGLLAQVVGALMLGLIKPNEFIAEVLENIDVPRDEAMHIAQDLNREIFNDVKDLLKELNSMGTKKHGVPTGLVLSPIQNVTSAQPKPIVAITPPLPPAPAKVATPPPPPPLPSPPKVAPVVLRDPNQPIRSDWGWHGSKNETTGQIEFKHETIVPTVSVSQKSTTLPTISPLPQRQSSNNQPLITVAGAAHVGSIFEQKLGGAFTMKIETPNYTGTTSARADEQVSPAPHRADTTGAPKLSVLHPVVVGSPPFSPSLGAGEHGNMFTDPSLVEISQSSTTPVAEQGSLRGAAGLHVPHKPTQVPIPPVQVFQQPRNE